MHKIKKILLLDKNTTPSQFFKSWLIKVVSKDIEISILTRPHPVKTYKIGVQISQVNADLRDPLDKYCKKLSRNVFIKGIIMARPSLIPIKTNIAAKNKKLLHDPNTTYAQFVESKLSTIIDGNAEIALLVLLHPALCNNVKILTQAFKTACNGSIDIVKYATESLLKTKKIQKDEQFWEHIMIHAVEEKDTSKVYEALTDLLVKNAVSIYPKLLNKMFVVCATITTADERKRIGEQKLKNIFVEMLQHPAFSINAATNSLYEELHRDVPDIKTIQNGALYDALIQTSTEPQFMSAIQAKTKNIMHTSSQVADIFLF